MPAREQPEASHDGTSQRPGAGRDPTWSRDDDRRSAGHAHRRAHRTEPVAVADLDARRHGGIDRLAARSPSRSCAPGRRSSPADCSPASSRRGSSPSLAALLGCALGVSASRGSRARRSSPPRPSAASSSSGCSRRVIVGGSGALPDIGDLLSKSFTESNLLRPPIRMSTGFARARRLAHGRHRVRGDVDGRSCCAVRRWRCSSRCRSRRSRRSALRATNRSPAASSSSCAFAIALFLLSTDRSVTRRGRRPDRATSSDARCARVPVVGAIVVVPRPRRADGPALPAADHQPGPRGAEAEDDPDQRDARTASCSR